MNKYSYFVALAIGIGGMGGAAMAQDANRNPAPAQPGQSQPSPARPGDNPGQAATPDPATPGITDRAAQGLSNLITDWRLEDLPPAVQKTIQEKSGGQKIADIDREDRSGRTVWEVEFSQAGRNTEFHVDDNGKLLPEEDGLFGRANPTNPTPGRPGERPTATGTPAGTQTGRSGVALAMGTQWEDLPKAVQQKAMRYGGKEKVADIDREDMKGKVAYEVEFRREGRNLEICFGEDGSILKSSDPSAAPAQGSAPSTEAGRSPATPSNPQPAQPQPLPPAQPLPEPQPDQDPRP